MIRFACPSCNGVVKLRNARAGSKCYCPKCGQRLAVPNVVSAEAIEERVRFECPACQTALSSPASKSGTKFHCPRCGQRILIPTPTTKKTVLGQVLPPGDGLPIAPESSSARRPASWLEDLRVWYGLEVLPAGSPPAPSTVSPAPASDPTTPLVKVPSALDPAVASPPTLVPFAGAPRALPVIASSPPPSRQQIPPVPVALVKEQPVEPTKPASRPSETVADSIARRAAEETGIDLQTGEIVDPARYEKWKQAGCGSTGSRASANSVPLMEAFRRARIAVENWVDDEAHRSLILTGDPQQLTRCPEVSALLHEYAVHGTVFGEKLARHFAFIVENRKQFYAARRD